MSFLLVHSIQIISYSEHCENPENSQYYFAILYWQFHTEGHTRVGEIVKFKPVAKNFYLAPATHLHIEMNRHLHNLVHNNDCQAYQKIR